MLSLNSTNERYRAPLIANLLLILTLFQASSFSLTLAFRGPLQSATLTAMITALWLLMYGTAILGLFFSFGVNWLTWMVRYRLLLVLLLAGTAFSSTWSVDFNLSAERSIHLIGTTAVALFLAFSLPLQHILRTSAWVLGFLMAASIFTAVLVPSLGKQNYEGTLVWAGVLASKNTLGFWAAITILLSTSISFWKAPLASRALYLGIAALAFVNLFFSVSATSILALISAGGVMIYLHIAFSLRLSILALVMLLLFGCGLAGLTIHYIDAASLIGRSGDLTGRAEVWEQTWKLIMQRPLTGYGYGTIWYPTADTLWIQKLLTDFSWTVYHAHNGLLHLASEIGVPLTLLTVFMLLQQLVEIIYCQYKRQQPGVLFVLGFTIALLVSNYSEARLLVNRDLYWIFLIMLPISMLQQVTFSEPVNTFSVNAGPVSANEAYRLRQIRQRKEQKLNLKERMRKLSELRVVNPANTQSAEPISTEASSGYSVVNLKNKRRPKKVD